MSSVDKDFENFVHYEKKYVTTYKELFITFLAFSIILFVLYPKNLLKDQILSESSNYDLSMLYLKNMLENDPTNESLMIGLAEQSLRSGKRDLSLRLLELLYESEDFDMRRRAYLLSYKLAKEDYFFFKSEEKKKEQIIKVEKLYQNIMDNLLYDESDYDTWYIEAIFIKNALWAYHFLKQKIGLEPNSIKLKEEAYYLAMRLNKRDDAIDFLHSLQRIDKARKKKWVNAEYQLAMSKKRYMQAEMILKAHSSSSLYFKHELAKFYNFRGAYIKSSDIYMSIYANIKKDLAKKVYLLKALDTLQAGRYTKESVNLASQYENKYINDREVRSYMLKLYIAAGDLKKANALAKKLLLKRR